MTVNGKRRVLLVAGARPNFMKIAPIYRASLAVPGVDCRIVHTEQHYDREMSQSFFDDLDIPSPAFFWKQVPVPTQCKRQKLWWPLKRFVRRNGPIL